MGNMGNATGPSFRVNDTFVVNLDLPPSERWKEAAKAKAPELAAFVKDFLAMLPPAVSDLVPLFEWLLDDAESVLPKPYRDEITGLAEAAGVDRGEVGLMNVFYEITAGCTGIVARDARTNYTIHGRNLDYGLPGLQNLTANVDFIRGNSSSAVVARGTTYIGYVGLLTGVRTGGFSIQLNQRGTKNGSIFDNALEAPFHGGAVASFLIRDTLLSDAPFASALETFETHHLIAPCYLIVGGAGGEAAVVTRERQSAADTLRLDDPKNPYGFFLVETNYDHWVSPPASDDRRSYTVSHMRDLGPGNTTAEAMLRVMGMWPTLNAETTYTTLMSPVDPSIYVTYTRNN